MNVTAETININDEDDDLPLMMFSDEVTFETLLDSGSKMMDTMMPEIQQDAGYDATNLSFEEFCKKHTSKDV